MKGKYQDREFYCRYRKPRFFGSIGKSSPYILFQIKPFKAPKQTALQYISSFPSPNRITPNVTFPAGYLTYEMLEPRDYSKPNPQQFILQILDELVQAAKIVENDPKSIDQKEQKFQKVPKSKAREQVEESLLIFFGIFSGICLVEKIGTHSVGTYRPPISWKELFEKLPFILLLSSILTAVIAFSKFLRQRKS